MRHFFVDFIFGITACLALAVVVAIAVFLKQSGAAKAKEKEELPHSNVRSDIDQGMPNPDLNVRANLKKGTVERSRVSGAQPVEDGGSYRFVCLLCEKKFQSAPKGICPNDGTKLLQIKDNLEPGSRFAEYYEIIQPLGIGGLSKVFQARHINRGDVVALKLLHSHLVSDEQSVQRLQREARSLAKLSHPNLVRVDDFMISPEGIPFILMEFLEGESLKQRLARQGKISWKETAKIFEQVCQGLGHAHSRKILHRDLKPGNIMLTTSNGQIVPKVVDFGLAKPLDADSMGRITEPGEVFGSPMYMSPEQCHGKDVDERSDVYAVGCIMYECLSGSAPFVGKTVLETMTMHYSAEVPEFNPLLKVPDWLMNTVMKCLAKAPNARNQSMEDIYVTLQKGLAASAGE